MLIHLRDLITPLSSHLRLAIRARMSLGIHPTWRQALRCRRRSCLFLWHHSHLDIYVIIYIISKKQTLISFSYSLTSSTSALSTRHFIRGITLIQQEKSYYIYLDIYIIEFNIYKSLGFINVLFHQPAEEGINSMTS